MSQLLKAHGSGNDFLIGSGEWAERLSRDPGLIRRLCDRRRGIGADGVLALRPDAPPRVGLRYFNADGSQAALCANGVRCAARAAVELFGLPGDLVVATDAGDVPASVRTDSVRVDLPAPTGRPAPVVLEVGSGSVRGWRAVIGVPHLVVPEVAGLDGLALEEIGPPLRRHHSLGPEGANVSFSRLDPDGRLAVRSWERGVEGETLSCGTGVVAAALLHLGSSGGRRVACRTRGGDELLVEALGEPPSCPARLTGPAVLVAEVRPTSALLDG